MIELQARFNRNHAVDAVAVTDDVTNWKSIDVSAL